MKYLYLKRRKNRTRKDGTPFVEAYVRTKTSKYSNTAIEEYISPCKNLLVVGDSDSGKTRFVTRLYNEAREVYHRRKSQAIYISAVEPIAKWVECSIIPKWLKSNNQEYPRTQWQRVDLIEQYLQETRAVLFVDDLHKLAGRKLQIVKKLIKACSVFVGTVINEGKIPPSIRNMILGTEPRIVDLYTRTSYDATQVVAWLVIFVFFLTGMPEMALLAGGFNILAMGRRASSSKQ